MATINNLSSKDLIEAGDLVPIYDSSSGDTKKVSWDTAMKFGITPPDGDNDTSIATTAFVKTAAAAAVAAASGPSHVPATDFIKVGTGIYRAKRTYSYANLTVDVLTALPSPSPSALGVIIAFKNYVQSNNVVNTKRVIVYTYADAAGTIVNSESILAVRETAAVGAFIVLNEYSVEVIAPVISGNIYVKFILEGGNGYTQYTIVGYTL